MQSQKFYQAIYKKIEQKINLIFFKKMKRANEMVNNILIRGKIQEKFNINETQ